MSKDPSASQEIAAHIAGSVAFSRERRAAGLTTEALVETLFARVGTINRAEARACVGVLADALLDEFRRTREVTLPFGRVYEDLGVVAFEPNRDIMRAINPTRCRIKIRWPNSDHLKYLVGRWRG